MNLKCIFSNKGVVLITANIIQRVLYVALMVHCFNLVLTFATAIELKMGTIEGGYS